MSIQHRILQQLVYDGMHSRRTQIYSAQDDTCGWIFGDGADVLLKELNDEVATYRESEKRDSEKYRREKSRDFLSWLRNGQNIFHISGKAGLEKSTLMKFISSHKQTIEELQKWAGDKTLVFADFYFWNPGTMLQMSLSGFHRSILFEVLSRCPELIEHVFSKQWKQLEGNLGDPKVESVCSYGEEHIEEAFGVLVQNGQHAHHRFCFFVDGLDESYLGEKDHPKLAHRDLAKRLNIWTKGGDIKICASSRPYQEFLECLACPDNSRIDLHLLNRPDIFTYCSKRFRGKAGAIALINEIVENAHGVFLWAHLIVDKILVAIHQGDPYDILLKKLHEYPKQLDDLYAKLREPIETSDIDLKRSNKMLLLSANAPFTGNISALAFSWLDESDKRGGDIENPDFPYVDDIHPYSEEEIQERMENVKKQINSLARGFLELKQSDVPGFINSSFALNAGFSHRSARDFFLNSPDRMKSLMGSFKNFETSFPYGRLDLAGFIFGFKDFSRSNIRDLARRLKTFTSQHFGPGTIRKFQVAFRNLVGPSLLLSVDSFRGNGWLIAYSKTLTGLDDLIPQSFLHSTSWPKYEANDSTALLAALCRKDWKHAMCIIEDSAVLDYPISLTIDETVSEWPLWTIASIFTLHYQLSYRDYEGVANETIQRLHQHTMKNAADFQVCLWWWNGKGDPIGEEIIYIHPSKQDGWERAIIDFNTLVTVQKLKKDKHKTSIKPQDLGIIDGSSSETLYDACMEGVDFLLLDARWKGQSLLRYIVL